MPRGAWGVALQFAALISEGSRLSEGFLQALAISSNHWGFVKVISILITKHWLSEVCRFLEIFDDLD